MSEHGNDSATTRLIHAAIRADVHARVDDVMGRLERDIERLLDTDGLEPALEKALSDVSDVLAEGIVAQLREARRLRPEPPDLSA